MNTWTQTGHRLTYHNSGSAIASGDIVIVRSGASGKIGVAVTDIPATTGKGELSISGVHTLPKASGALSFGDVVYFNSGNGNLTATATGNTRAGTVVEAATTAATHVKVLVNDTPGPL